MEERVDECEYWPLFDLARFVQGSPKWFLEAERIAHPEIDRAIEKGVIEQLVRRTWARAGERKSEMS